MKSINTSTVAATELIGVPEAVVQSQNAALMLSVFGNIAFVVAIAYLWRQYNKTNERQLAVLLKSATTTKETVMLLQQLANTNQSLAREIDDLKDRVAGELKDVASIVSDIRSRMK